MLGSVGGLQSSSAWRWPWRLSVAFLLCLLCIDTASAQYEQRVALVIGNGAYVNAATLKNPANDAKAMAGALRRAGFDVIEAENANRRAMIEATRSFAERLSPGGIGLFFYAGHGIQSRGANYLLPVDVTLAVEDDLKYEAMDVQDILNKLDDARVRLSLVILDACRDNPFVRPGRSMARGLAQIDAPRGTIIAYSTAPGKTAADGDGDNGIYTSELLKAIGEPGRKLQDVFEQVADAVERRTANAQIPWISSSFLGEFYFLAPPAANAALPATAPPAEGPGAVSAEIVFWQSIAYSKDPADFEAYIQQFPRGAFVPLARIRIASLSKSVPPVPATVAPVPAAVAPLPVTDESAWSDAERRAVQIALIALGHYRGQVNGEFNAETRSAISRWQAFNGQMETGRVSNEQRAQMLRDQTRLAALLTIPPQSPRGATADAVKGAQARFLRGAAFERGEEQPKDGVEAAWWYALAANDGSSAAYTNLGTLYARGTGTLQRDVDAARLLWMTAAAIGEGTASFNLGALAESGFAGPADLTAAKRWYRLGAERKHAASAAALKRLGG